jgi:hypothetical protein
MAFTKFSTVPLEVTDGQPEWLKNADNDKAIKPDTKPVESNTTTDTSDAQKEDK